MKRTINYFLFIIIFLVFSCSEKNTQIVDLEKKPFTLSDSMFKTLTLEKIKKIPIQYELHFYGNIAVDNNKTVELFPIVGGNVTNVFVELGDYVNKGQLLCIIKSTQVAEFEKELEDAKIDIIVAENNLKVVKELFEGKINSERDVLEAKSKLDKAKSQLHRIEETYKIYNLKPNSIYEVRSPLNGFIIQKNINKDMLLRNDKSDNIFDIAELSQVWAMANVSESEINQIKIGINAEVTTLSYPDKIFYGKCDKMFNVIDNETKGMKVRIILNNKDYLLKPDMRANIKFYYTDKKKEMLSISSSAIIFDKNKYFVMVFNSKNDIITREIDIFKQVGDITYILNGVLENDNIITTNQLLIYNAINN